MEQFGGIFVAYGKKAGMERKRSGLMFVTFHDGNWKVTL